MYFNAGLKNTLPLPHPTPLNKITFNWVTPYVNSLCRPGVSFLKPPQRYVVHKFSLFNTDLTNNVALRWLRETHPSSVAFTV